MHKLFIKTGTFYGVLILLFIILCIIYILTGNFSLLNNETRHSNSTQKTITITTTLEPVGTFGSIMISDDENNSRSFINSGDFITTRTSISELLGTIVFSSGTQEQWQDYEDIQYLHSFNSILGGAIYDSEKDSFLGNLGMNPQYLVPAIESTCIQKVYIQLLNYCNLESIKDKYGFACETSIKRPISQLSTFNCIGGSYKTDTENKKYSLVVRVRNRSLANISCSIWNTSTIETISTILNEKYHIIPNDPLDWCHAVLG